MNLEKSRAEREGRRPFIHTKWNQRFFLLFTSLFLIAANVAGCRPRAEDLEAVEYTPLPGDDWKVSTPDEQGLDPMLVAKLYLNAAEVQTLHALLVVKNGYLIAEGYFHGGSVDQKTRLQSATKSFTSALVVIALDQGYLSSVDQKMMDFFPEFAAQITDPRKDQITIRHMLQMRAGYPWEESTANTRGTESSLPSGYMIPCKSIRRTPGITKWDVITATWGTAISGGPPGQGTIVSTPRGDMGGNRLPWWMSSTW